jgi:anthranilate phosphoribosyltransferase
VNAAAVRAVLAGQTGPVRDIVLLNAAAAMTAARLGASGSGSGAVICSDSESLTKELGDGLARAAAAVDSGATADLLDRWTRVSNRLATPRPRS